MPDDASKRNGGPQVWQVIGAAASGLLSAFALVNVATAPMERDIAANKSQIADIREEIKAAIALGDERRQANMQRQNDIDAGQAVALSGLVDRVSKIEESRAQQVVDALLRLQEIEARLCALEQGSCKPDRFGGPPW